MSRARGSFSTGEFPSAVASASASDSGLSGRKLELCRRLDWRFLLPDPHLRHVAYAGSSKRLLEALQMFADSVFVFPCDEQQASMRSRFDLIVLNAPSLKIVQRAGPIVTPGGFVYMELGRIGKSSQEGSPRNLAGVLSFARVLWAAGFDDVHAYWHRPGFEDCREIVPLFDRVAMRFVLAPGGASTLLHQVKMLTSRWLLNTGLLHHVIPSYSIIAHKRSRDRN